MAVDFTEIPKLDLSDFVSGNVPSKQKFVSDLGTAYENIGFVAIRNHGIDDQLLSGLYRVVADFFLGNNPF